MGTRSTTKIYGDGQFLLAIYKQMDGYIEGWGATLKSFIKSGVFVNGFNHDETKRQFNGAGCFALQLVAEYKDGVGELYATTEDDEQEYNYRIDVIYDKNIQFEKVIITCDKDPTFTEVFK